MNWFGMLIVPGNKEIPKVTVSVKETKDGQYYAKSDCGEIEAEGYDALETAKIVYEFTVQWRRG
ncbi:hypothetical protein [Bacillus sp. SG-1]|uniref:hypothetical protein n=1 Tax=Bacillus sp. SG-1 TaxID=161544 RepID=UPI0003027751|nr:hypothetical protein [Bacillus sp. SG-1]